jgi:hypothetical protein
MISPRELLIWTSAILNYAMFDELILFGVYREHNQVLIKTLGILYIILMPTFLYFGLKSSGINCKIMIFTSMLSGLTLWGFMKLMSSKCHPILMIQAFIAIIQAVSSLYCAFMPVPNNPSEKEIELGPDGEDDELLPRYIK